MKKDKIYIKTLFVGEEIRGIIEKKKQNPTKSNKD
jgi:hypothetical protein